MSLNDEQKAALKVLINSSPELRNALLKHADKKLVCTICEVVLNVLRGNVALEAQERQKLSKHKKFFRTVVRKGKSWKQKRKIIQKGGGVIISLLASILGALLGNLL